MMNPGGGMENMLRLIKNLVRQPVEHIETPKLNSHGLELVNHTRHWYHDQYKRFASLCFGLVIALICSLILNGILFFVNVQGYGRK
jgi:hypothetical protein